MKEEQVKQIQVFLEEVHGEKVQWIETHASWLLLVDGFTYKMKKPLDLGFLDFSTFEKRKHYCEEEYRLNRRLTEGIYLGVLEVRKTPEGKVVLDTEIAGEVIDHAVKMKKLDLDHQMDHLLEEGKVTEPSIKMIAEQVADFHRDAEVIDHQPSKAELKERFNDLLNEKPVIDKWLGEVKGELIQEAVRLSDDYIDAHFDLFEQRAEEGMIRDGHGDLHSGNIFLYEKPVIFDCIEFNPEFRKIDVLDEIAFFCMDLEAFGQKALSSLFVREYLNRFKAIEKEKELALLTYYKCYRANIRLKVNAIQIGQAHNEQERKEKLESIELYFELMNQYLHQLGSRAEV